MRTTLTPILLAGALLLAACGGGSEAADGSGATDDGAGSGTTIVASEFAFEPSSFSLPADTDTELTLENTGVVEHDIVVEELEDLHLVHADAGETVTETVNVPAGSYTVYCSIPGHRDAGMEGSLTVE